MYYNSDVLGSSISSLSLAAETPEVYNSDAQSPIYRSFDDIGTFGGNNDRDGDGNMYHASTVFGSSQYSASLAAESPEVYNFDAQSPIYDDYGTFGGNIDRDSNGNMDDDDDEDDVEHVIDDDVSNAVVSCCRSDSLSLPNNVVVVVVFSFFIPYVPSSAFLSPPPQLRRTMCTESTSYRRIGIKAETDFSRYKTALCSPICRVLRRVHL